MQVAALPPGWPPREANASVRESTPTEGNDEHPKCSPCNRYRILITPMFGMVLGIIGINYAPYVLWTPHATWLSWVALVSPLTLLPASIIGEPASHHQPVPLQRPASQILTSLRLPPASQPPSSPQLAAPLMLTSLRLVLTRRSFTCSSSCSSRPTSTAC